MNPFAKLSAACALLGWSMAALAASSPTTVPAHLATVHRERVPHTGDNLILIVAADESEHAHALSLESMLHGRDAHEEQGTALMIGDTDRAKARDAFTAIVAHAPPEVRQLGTDMYSEQFSELGLETAPEPQASASH